MSATSVRYEVFEEDKPSYLPSYIMSGFVLFAIIGLAYHRVPLWPLSLAHPFFAAWFGVLFFWMLRNARERRLFLSHRLIEVIGKSDSDVYFLPRTADLEQLVAALRAGNPEVRVTT